MLNPSTEHFCKSCAAAIGVATIRRLSVSAPEQDLVHDAAWSECEQARDHQRSAEQADHCEAMALHRMAVRLANAEGEHDEREDRQEVDGAPGSPQSDLLHPKRADGDRQHDRRPGVAERPMLRGALRARQLHGAQHKGAERSIGVHLDG